MTTLVSKQSSLLNSINLSQSLISLILNPSILPPDYWENHTEYFRAANGKIFETSLITKKPIGIQFFPNYIIWQKIIGLDLPDKDLLLGFDILQLVKSLHHSHMH